MAASAASVEEEEEGPTLEIRWMTAVQEVDVHSGDLSKASPASSAVSRGIWRMRAQILRCLAIGVVLSVAQEAGRSTSGDTDRSCAKGVQVTASKTSARASPPQDVGTSPFYQYVARRSRWVRKLACFPRLVTTRSLKNCHIEGRNPRVVVP